LAHRIAFFYAPKIMGGRDAIKAVAGAGLTRPEDWLRLEDARWRRLGEDWYLSARLKERRG
jgi:riboflavin biosynthesis pyrimidine reductase